MPRPKNGNWVVLQGNPPKVGIVFSAGDEESTVHVVDQNGETVETTTVPNNAIQRAREQDIPAKRRAHFEESVKQLGSKRETPGADRPPTSSRG